MRKLVLLALVGLAAQLVDGSLGMGYGMTSSSLLLLAGLSPALASASVHLAEIGTTLASGASHWRLGNTDPRLLDRQGQPDAGPMSWGASPCARPEAPIVGVPRTAGGSWFPWDWWAVSLTPPVVAAGGRS